MCSTECIDGKNNTWTSNCLGTMCMCAYNGFTYCSCVIPGASCLEARTCCPGLP